MGTASQPALTTGSRYFRPLFAIFAILALLAGPLAVAGEANHENDSSDGTIYLGDGPEEEQQNCRDFTFNYEGGLTDSAFVCGDSEGDVQNVTSEEVPGLHAEALHLSCSTDYTENPDAAGNDLTVEHWTIRWYKPQGFHKECNEGLTEDGSVTVAKEWEGDEFDDSDVTVTFTANIDEGEDFALAPGAQRTLAVDETLTVTDEEVTGLPEGCRYTSDLDDIDASFTATEENLHGTITITNDVTCELPPGPGSVTIAKEVTGDAPTELGDFEFDLVCNGSTIHDGSITLADGENTGDAFDDISDGSECTVEETETQGADSVSWEVEGSGADDGSGSGSESDSFTVNEDEDITVTFTNDYEDDTPPPPPEPGDGEVTVEKNVIGDAPLVLEDFPFEVVCNGSTEASFSLGDGESDSTNVGDGSTCTVEETDAQDAGVSWTIDDDVTGEGTETDEFEVNEGDDIVVTFTNDFGAVLGTALIAVDFDKVWTGDDADLDDVTVAFDVEVDGVAVGSYSPGDELELELHEGGLTEVEITGETVEGFAEANETCSYTPAFPDAEAFDFDSEGATLTVENEVECAEVLAEVEVEEEEEEVLPKTGASTTALAILGLLGMAAGSLLLRRRPGQVI